MKLTYINVPVLTKTIRALSISGRKLRFYKKIPFQKESIPGMLRYLLSKNETIIDPLIETLISGYFFLVVCGEKMKKEINWTK